MRFVAFSSLALSFIPSLSLFLCLVCLACSLFKSQLFIIFVVLVYCTFSFAFAFIFLWFNWTFWDCNFFFAVLHSLSLSLLPLSLSLALFSLFPKHFAQLHNLLLLLLFIWHKIHLLFVEFALNLVFFWRIKSEMPTCKFIYKFNICFNVCAVLLYV